jgi:hypothetical protein
MDILAGYDSISVARTLLAWLGCNTYRPRSSDAVAYESPQTCEILFHTGNLLGVRIAHHRQEVAARSSRCRFSKALLVVVRLARCSRRSDSMVNKLRIVIANEQRQLLTLVFGVFLFLMTLFAQHLQFRDSHLRRDARAADRPASHVLRDEGFANLRSSAIALATSAVGPR